MLVFSYGFSSLISNFTSIISELKQIEIEILKALIGSFSNYFVVFLFVRNG